MLYLFFISWFICFWRSRGLSCKPNIYVPWSTSELRARLAPWNQFKPSSKYLYWLFQGGTFLWIICVFVSCVFHAFASVHCCIVVTCRGRADLLALVGEVIVFLLLSHVIFWVRFGTWLYRFLICPLSYLVQKWENEMKLEYTTDGMPLQIPTLFYFTRSIPSPTPWAWPRQQNDILFNMFSILFCDNTHKVWYKNLWNDLVAEI